ncbi:hypothetical protein FXF53_04515 [Micromonospora sp. WP24]|uniref:hypothetical protein n=1 Tax=Micromonospora sp. WP24 TaxID=2604469 RepID=UPI0011D4877F|nr:hypothetical protein [Micromonospora sp. WP24]TYC05683.1 hypothetical protein FXF53_04515 [Micromonospora sp. WP24]
MTAEVARAGLSAHPVGMAPDIDRPCGFVHVFPTGNLAEPAHPRWCDRIDCRRRGQHRSQAHHLDTNRPEPFTLYAALVQALHPAAQPMVCLTSLGDEASAGLVLSIGHARVLRYRLADLLDAVKPTPGGGH